MNKILYTQKDFYLIIKKNLRRIHYESGYSRAYVAEHVDLSFQAYSDMLNPFFNRTLSFFGNVTKNV